MAINSQLSTTKSKIQTKLTSRTETESQIWRIFEGLSLGRRKGEDGGKGAGSQKYKLVVREQTDVKNSTGNGVAKELVCIIYGHELREDCQREWGVPGGGGQREKIGTVIA